MLTESTLVAMTAGALSVLFDYGALQLIVANAPMDLTLATNVHMDWRVVAACAGRVGILMMLITPIACLAPCRRA